MIEAITVTSNLLTSNTLRVYHEAEPQYVRIPYILKSFSTQELTKGGHHSELLGRWGFDAFVCHIQIEVEACG